MGSNLSFQTCCQSVDRIRFAGPWYFFDDVDGFCCSFFGWLNLMFARVVGDEHCNSWSAVVQQVRSVVGFVIGVCTAR